MIKGTNCVRKRARISTDQLHSSITHAAQKIGTNVLIHAKVLFHLYSSLTDDSDIRIKIFNETVDEMVKKYGVTYMSKDAYD